MFVSFYMWFSTSGAKKIICLLHNVLSVHGYLIGRAGAERDGVMHEYLTGQQWLWHIISESFKEISASVSK
jgi:hypothetical protein